MTNIIFIEPDGTTRPTIVPTGLTLLRAALDNGIAGILGDCGGNCTCATCHIYAEGPAAALLPAPREDETAMLEGALHPCQTSRLACQLAVTTALDGLVVRMPPAQV
jgi:2Fe-2S ferredoxin